MWSPSSLALPGGALQVGVDGLTAMCEAKPRSPSSLSGTSIHLVVPQSPLLGTKN